MAESTTEIDLDSVIDRLLEGELAHYPSIRSRAKDGMVAECGHLGFGGQGGQREVSGTDRMGYVGLAGTAMLCMQCGVRLY